MQKGVHDYESQAEMINRQLAVEIANGNTQAVKRLERKLSDLANLGGAYVTLTNTLEYDIEQLSLVKAKYKEAKIDAEQVLPQKFIVSKAYEAEQKSYPIRWLIVIVSVFSAFLLSLIIIVLIDRYQWLKLNELKKN